MTTREPTIELDWWLDGVPFAHKRELTLDEAAELHAQLGAFRARVSARRVVLRVAVVVSAVAAVLWFALLGWRVGPDVLVAALLFSGAVGALLGIWALGRWRLEQRLVRRPLDAAVSDIAHRQVFVFAWPAPRDGPRIELLPRSAIVFRANGVRPRVLTRAHPRALARAPRDAFEAAYRPGAGDVVLGEGATTTQRALTPSERTELRRHLDDERTGRLRRAIPAAYVVSLLVWEMAKHAGVHGVALAAVTIGGAALTAAGAWLRQGSWIEELEADLSAGRALVVRARGATDDAPLVEVLPRSGLAWTELGVPAQWRHLRGVPASERPGWSQRPGA